MSAECFKIACPIDLVKYGSKSFNRMLDALGDSDLVIRSQNSNLLIANKFGQKPPPMPRFYSFESGDVYDLLKEKGRERRWEEWNQSQTPIFYCETLLWAAPKTPVNNIVDLNKFTKSIAKQIEGQYKWARKSGNRLILGSVEAKMTHSRNTNPFENYLFRLLLDNQDVQPSELGSVEFIEDFKLIPFPSAELLDEMFVQESNSRQPKQLTIDYPFYIPLNPQSDFFDLLTEEARIADIRLVNKTSDHLESGASRSINY